jgi:hypothetical protein
VSINLLQWIARARASIVLDTFSLSGFDVHFTGSGSETSFISLPSGAITLRGVVGVETLSWIKDFVPVELSGIRYF